MLFLVVVDGVCASLRHTFAVAGELIDISCSRRRNGYYDGDGMRGMAWARKGSTRSLISYN